MQLVFGGAHEADAILHMAEFGVVLLLFLIGLERWPKRLWAMRTAILGFWQRSGSLSGLLLAALGLAIGLHWLPAVFVGLALALSSTAFALQVLEENGDLRARARSDQETLAALFADDAQV